MKIPLLSANAYFAQRLSRAIGMVFNMLSVYNVFMLNSFRRELFQHMYNTHHFNIGSPENMVHINELLDILKEKLDK